MKHLLSVLACDATQPEERRIEEWSGTMIPSVGELAAAAADDALYVQVLLGHAGRLRSRRTAGVRGDRRNRGDYGGGEAAGDGDEPVPLAQWASARSRSLSIWVTSPIPTTAQQVIEFPVEDPLARPRLARHAHTRTPREILSLFLERQSVRDLR